MLFEKSDSSLPVNVAGLIWLQLISVDRTDRASLLMSVCSSLRCLLLLRLVRKARRPRIAFSFPRNIDCDILIGWSVQVIDSPELFMISAPTVHGRFPGLHRCRNVQSVMPQCSVSDAAMFSLWCHNVQFLMPQCSVCDATMFSLWCHNVQSVMPQCSVYDATMVRLWSHNVQSLMPQCSVSDAAMFSLWCHNVQSMMPQWSIWCHNVQSMMPQCSVYNATVLNLWYATMLILWCHNTQSLIW